MSGNTPAMGENKALSDQRKGDRGNHFSQERKSIKEQAQWITVTFRTMNRKKAKCFYIKTRLNIFKSYSTEGQTYCNLISLRPVGICLEYTKWKMQHIHKGSSKATVCEK